MRYRVYVPEVHYQIVEVEARSKAEALEKAPDALATNDGSLELEYSHTIEDKNLWRCET